jgi:LysM repeat protein
MSEKDSAQNVIDSYRKRQQRTPFIVGGIAVTLVIVGILLVALWLTGGINVGGLLATSTPTPTETFTPTLTPTVTETPTPTETLAPSDTPEPTVTETPAGPFVYIVEEGDTCFSIAEKFQVDLLYLMQLNGLTDACIIQVSQELLIPPPGSSTLTPTALPENLPPGTRIQYTVLAGDSLEGIAIKFNSTAARIREDNPDLIGENDEIFPGQVLTIVVNIATPIPTSTPGISTRLTQQAELTLTVTPNP